MTTFSNSRLLVAGDVDTGRGQLGIGWAGTATTGTLWSLRSGGNHYSMTSASSITITLPDVGTGSSQAQPGYWATIVNTGSNLITVQNFAAVTINTLAAGKSAMYIAVATAFAASNWVLQYDTSNYNAATTLQQAYNTSGTAYPQILLSSTNGAVKIQDNSTPIDAPLFNVLTSAAASIFRIGNSTFPNSAAFFGGNNNAIRTFVVGTGTASSADAVVFGSGTASGANTFIVGTSSASGAGSTILSDSSFAGTYSGVGIFYQLYTGGTWIYGGVVQEGITKTSPNRRTLFFSATTAVTTGLIAIPILTTVSNTTYRLTVTAYGRDATITSAVSATHIINALVTDLVGVASLVSQQLSTIETVGYTSVPSNAVLSVATNVVTLTLQAPDNINGGFTIGTMDYRVIVEYSSLTE